MTHFCKRGVKKLVILYGHHNCMILNVKRVMFLALVPVLQGTVKQPPSLFSICTFQMKGNLHIFNLQEWH